MNTPRLRALFVLGCAAVIALEAYVLFFDHDYVFSIQGRNSYKIHEFGAGQPVAHGFLMRGNGLHAVRVQLSSNGSATVQLRWRLLRQQTSDDRLAIAEWGLRELRLQSAGTWATLRLQSAGTWATNPSSGAEPEQLATVHEDTREVQIEPGRTWLTFPVTRDGSSHDRWYVFEAQLVDAPSDARDRAELALMATHDNPDRGGSLFVAGVNKPGSLVLRADRVGPTLYQRFVAEAEPNLPRWMQWPAVQWMIAIALHAAVAAYAYALLIDRSLLGQADG